jgi:hypothetical protein
MEFKVDRKKCNLIRHHQNDNGFVEASFGERLSIVWDLTRQVWPFTGKYAEQRLQRDVAKLIRQ